MEKLYTENTEWLNRCYRHWC